MGHFSARNGWFRSPDRLQPLLCDRQHGRSARTTRMGTFGSSRPRWRSRRPGARNEGDGNDVIRVPVQHSDGLPSHRVRVSAPPPIRWAHLLDG